MRSDFEEEDGSGGEGNFLWTTRKNVEPSRPFSICRRERVSGDTNANNSGPAYSGRGGDSLAGRTRRAIRFWGGKEVSELVRGSTSEGSWRSSESLATASLRLCKIGATLTSVSVVRIRTSPFVTDSTLAMQNDNHFRKDRSKRMNCYSLTLSLTRVLPKTHTSISCPTLTTRTWDSSVFSTWDAWISL